jgi:hypothetical protein
LDLFNLNSNSSNVVNKVLADALNNNKPFVSESSLFVARAALNSNNKEEVSVVLSPPVVNNRSLLGDKVVVNVVVEGTWYSYSNVVPSDNSSSFNNVVANRFTIFWIYNL